MCHLNKGGRTQRAPLLHYQAGVPGERVHLDFLGPFTTSDSGNKYILMMIDQFSRWLELYALPEQTAVITAKHSLGNGFLSSGHRYRYIPTRVETLMARYSQTYVE